jgi:hypothetical protein
MAYRPSAGDRREERVVAGSGDRLPSSFFHGTKADLQPGDLIEGRDPSAHTDREGAPKFVYLMGTVDAAAWQSELAPGEGPGRIYAVEPTGPVTAADEGAEERYPVGADASYRSRDPLRVTGEITDRQGRPRRLYHGTKADLDVGDVIEPGHAPNFGEPDRTTTYVYLTGTLDAAVWGAELALGQGPGRIYAVEPTGPIADDPNLTNTKYRGNPTKSYRSREPLRVTGEVMGWQGHPQEALEAMKESVERRRREGVGPIDD